MEDIVLNLALAVISLLLIATIVAYLLRNSRLPFTVILVVVGIGLGYLTQTIPALAYFQHFRLSPELVFYVFLPTLIFESAFNMNVQHFKQNIHMIGALSTLGMLFSAVFVAYGMTLWLGIPWPVALLFGALISATDPISVLALFKKIGVPKRLSTIIEGESLFNDGMALVLFGIFLEMATRGGGAPLQFNWLSSFGNFALVVFGGIFTGLVLGALFSKALDYVKNSREIEISITLILAHATFIIAEYALGVSGILATVAAGIVIGNYGAYKISPDVKKTMEEFWDYSAFLANSLLFLMVGLIIYSVKDAVVPLLLPSLAVVGLVMLARVVMVYTILPLMNMVYPRERIPASWMHVVQWSGLRGALSIALILTLPENFVYYEELLIFTTAVIFVTIILNGLSMQPLLSWLGLQRFSAAEHFENDENQMIIDQRVHEKLKHMKDMGFISKEVFNEVCDDYKRHEDDCSAHIRLLCVEEGSLTDKELEAILKRHLLGIERHTFTRLYYHGEITQDLLNVLINNVTRQLENQNIEETIRLGRLTWLKHNGKLAKTLEKFGFQGLCKSIRRKETMLRFEMYRARLIATTEVLDALKQIKGSKAFINEELILDFESRYQHWKENAQAKLELLEEKDPVACRDIQLYLARQAAFQVENKTLTKLLESGMTSPKVFNQLKKDLELRQESLKA